jgi:YD repeat-containing protein
MNMGRLTGTSTQYAFLTSRTFTTSYSYDPASNRVAFTDPEGGSTIYAFDTLNRLQTLNPPAAISGGNFGFGYDALSRRTSLTRPNAVNTSYSYDNLSRLLSVTHTLSGTTLDGATYTIDNAGNRLTRTPQPNGTTSTFGYDNIYEVQSVTQNGSTTESYNPARLPRGLSVPPRAFLIMTWGATTGQGFESSIAFLAFKLSHTAFGNAARSTTLRSCDCASIEILTHFCSETARYSVFAIDLPANAV